MTNKITNECILFNAFYNLNIFIFKRNYTFLILLLILASTNMFAQSGKDGTLTINTANTVLSRYTKPTASIPVGAITITVSSIADLNRDGIGYLPAGFVTNPSGFASDALAAGDLLMIYQAQGATINITDTVAYGTVAALNGAGTYELVRVASVTGNVITLSCATKQSYLLTGHVQIIRVPQYSTLTVNSGGSVVAIPWGAPSFGGADPSADIRRKGGVNVFLSKNIINNGSINANKAGFRGGTRENSTSPQGNTFYTSFVTTNAALSAEKGESIAGYTTDYDLLGGRYGRGAAANGGGGGNAHNAGGGGGANGGNEVDWFKGAGVMQSSGICGTTAWTLDPDYKGNGNNLTTSSGGGRGGYTFGSNNLDACTQGPSYPIGAISPAIPATAVLVAWGGDNRDAVGGLGGRPVTSTTFQNRLIFGGGGGAGDGNNAANADGGDGGGIVFILNDNSISGTGTLQANGEDGLNTIGGHNDAPGGGGGGGSVLIQSTILPAFQTVNANGGKGGNQLITIAESEGPGGGGGVIATNIIADTSTKTVAGGSNGTTNSTSLTEFPANGATSGNSGTIVSIAETISVCGVCYKPYATSGTTLDTKIGITALSRAGADNGSWPMVRKGAHIALEAKTKGFVPTRIASPETAITNPVDGMMVYDTTLNCLRIYVVDSVIPANTGWKCFNNQTCPD